MSRFDKANARHTEVTDLIAERMARKHQIEAYLKNLRSREPLTEFRETDWLAMVDYITVHSKDDIRVTFKTAPRSKHKPIDATTPLNHIGSEAFFVYSSTMYSRKISIMKSALAGV